MASALDATMTNAFQDIEELEGINFFEDYCNYIIDKD
jgi:hypothetical protein